jgi:hypothetical protein
MKQTAVEWLHTKLSTCTSEELVGNINNWFEQAKAMEKEQTCGFVRDYIDDKCYASFKGCVQCSGSLEDYYDQTFNTNEK